MIQIELDSRAIQQALDQLTGRLNNMQPVMRDIGEQLVSSIQENLGRGLDYNGRPFTPLKRRRQRQGRRRAGDIPLNDTRQHIYNKITYRAHETYVEVGMFENVPIGATHQFGATINHSARTRSINFRIGRDGRSRFARANRANFQQTVNIGEHQTTIPPRPFLPIANGQVDLPAEWEQKILDKIAEFIIP